LDYNKIVKFSYKSKETRPMWTGARNLLGDKRGGGKNYRDPQLW